MPASGEVEPLKPARDLAAASMEGAVVVEATIVCPECGRSEAETMPVHARQQRYGCKACGAILKPKPGDCCVYCSYSTAPCPPLQARIWGLLGELLVHDGAVVVDSGHLARRRH